MTQRAVAVLRSVDRVLAEDTRRTAILCRAHGISTPLVSAHAHNEAARAAQVLEWLAAGESLALVSDAGTPLLSDPGARLVAAVVAAGHAVVPVPGPAAALAALVASGLPTEPFTFHGFLPRGGRERSERLAEVASQRHTSILYESPQRLVRLLRDLEAVAGAGRRVVVARELTKVHEEFRRGSLEEVAAYYEAEGVRGEVVVVLEGAASVAPDADDGAVDRAAATALARALLDAGGRPSAVAREVSRRLSVPRNAAYEIVQGMKEEPGAS